MIFETDGRRVRKVAQRVGCFVVVFSIMRSQNKYLGFVTPSPPRALIFLVISIAKRARSSLCNTDYSHARETTIRGEGGRERERKRDKASSHSEIGISKNGVASEATRRRK